MSHPIAVRSIHIHHAALPGRYVTFVVTTLWQYGQRTTPGISCRYVSEIGTGCGWVTTAGCVWLLLTDGITPTEIQRKDRGRYQKHYERKVKCFTSSLDICLHTQSSNKYLAFILCVGGWTMFPVLCGGKVTAVGTLGGVRTGKGSCWIVTMEKRKKFLRISAFSRKQTLITSNVATFKCALVHVGCLSSSSTTFWL